MTLTRKVYKKSIFAVVIFTVLVLVTNHFLLAQLILGEPIIHVYYYHTSDCKLGMVEYPEKGSGFDTMYKRFENKKNFGEIPPDVVLYRDFSKNYLKFWKWGDYLTHNRWKLEYKEKCI